MSGSLYVSGKYIQNAQIFAVRSRFSICHEMRSFDIIQVNIR